MQEMQQGDGKSQARTFLGISFPWIIVLIGVLLLMLVNVNSNTFGVFFKPIAGEFGWSRSAVSTALAIRSLLAAVFVVPMGYWSDRYGPRRVVLPCFLLLGVSMILIAKVSALWQLYLVQGLCVGVASSGPFVCVISTVAKWHVRRPGLAL